MRVKFSHLVVYGLFTALLSSWFTATVMSQSPVEKARNRAVAVKSLTGTCSGVILQTNLVMTAGHCVTEVGTITVEGREAKLYKKDAKIDLALLFVETIAIDRVIVAEPEVGSDVFSWGFPLGSPNRVFSRGYIAVVQYDSIFSTTLAAPGSSGSGLYDKNGRLIGITTNYMDATGFAVSRLPSQIHQIWEVK